MDDEKIVLIARLKVKAESVAELKTAALKIVADSRDEAGNINYDINQSIEDETLFFRHEAWANKAALDEHFATPFFKEFFGVVEQIASSVTVSIRRLSMSMTTSANGNSPPLNEAKHL